MAAPALLEQAQGDPAGPLYELYRGDIYNLTVGAVVVNTDLYMLEDLQEFGQNRRRRWINGTGPPGGPSATRMYNEVHYANGLISGQTRLTTGGIRAHQPLVCMVNITPHNPGTNETLRQAYRRVLQRVYELPDNVLAMPNPQPWQNPPVPISIAFPLMGYGERYGYDNSAEQALSAITGWFNDAVHGAARRARITVVRLMIPGVRELLPGRIENAWRAAWDRYVGPGQPSIQIPRIGGNIRQREVNALRNEANDFIRGPLGAGGNPVLINPDGPVLVAPNVGPAHVPDNDEVRLNNRILRPRPGRSNIFGT